MKIIPLEGVYNLRDAGGYRAHGGTHVKTGLIYRGGDFHNLTPSATESFTKLGIKSFIDFRANDEIEKAPDSVPESVVNRYFLPIGPGSIADLRKIAADNPVLLMEEIYRHLVISFQDVYRGFFEILMNKDKAPVLFHCSAGKDRTGYAAALFLSALGVRRDDIINDYMLSNDCLVDKYTVFIAENPAMAPLMNVDKKYIESAFYAIDAEYGGMERYLAYNLNVDIPLMREIYTY